MRGSVTEQVLLLGIILSFIQPLRCQVQFLDKQGCNTTSSCFSKPSDCRSSDDCEYLLKYSVNGANATFEVSSNQHEWVAVGFNNLNQMSGGNSLVCQNNGSNIVLKHYVMPKEARPDWSKETKARIFSLQSSGRVMYCKFSRELDQGAGRYNLRKSLYLLYAGGPMATDSYLKKHIWTDTSSELVNLSVLTDNSVKRGVENVKYIDTAGCGKTKSCLRDPGSCKDNTDCNYLVTFQKDGSNVVFSVSGKADGWIAVGFNDKPKMSNTDSVICQGSNDNIKLWTAKLKYSQPDVQKSNETQLLQGKASGGFIYCKFSRPLQPKSNKMLDLIGRPRYIIYGKGSGTGSINKHKGSGSKGCSNIKVDFSSNKIYQLGDCYGDNLSKVHGSLMIWAWMFLVVISIFIARYSRKLWGGMQIFEKDAWFQIHRILMGLAVSITIISIIIIFVDKEGWSESAGDHAVFGIIVLVLAVIQPTVAFFRPHPDSSRRIFFNWFHRFVALLLAVMAVVSVFKGANLVEDNGGDVVSKILIVLLTIVFITTLILELLAFRIRMQQKEYIADPVVDTSKMQMVSENPGPTFWEVKAQRVLLIVLSVLVFILAVVMIAYVAGAGMDDDDDGNDDDGDDD